MANLEKVIRINETDYGTLVGGGTITKNGVEYEYDDSALYVIENPSPPAYALTAGQANTAVKDVLGRNIVDTYLTEGDAISQKTPLHMTTDNDVLSFTDIDGNSLTHAQVIALLQDNNKDVIIEKEGFWYILQYYHGGPWYYQCLEGDENTYQYFILSTDGDITLDIDGIYDIHFQPELISGTNIKTINNTSLLGSGDISVGTYSKPSTGIPASDLTSAVQTSLGKADTSVQDVKVKVGTGTAASIVDSNKVANITYDTIPTANSTNPVTSGGIKTALDTKVAKITSTDNAIARFDGTGGQIQNSGVTINDSNHVTAAKFITSGGTSSQFVKGNGSLDSTTYTPQTAAGASALLSSLPDWTATPTDTTKLVRRDTGGSASFGQVTFLTVWNYINSKAATVYAPLASPALTGTPTAPTATAGTNTTQIATTAFVQNAVTSAIAGVTQFNYQVVTTLPSTGQKGTIYLISNGGSGQNIYDEYIWYEDTDISGRWEKIGTTEVDLSGYAKLSPTSIQTFTGDHMLKGTLTVNNPSSGGSLPQPSEIAIGGNGKITLAGEGDFSKVISGSTTLQDALNGKQEAPLVIEVNDTDTNVPYDTYNNITAAVTAGKDVWLKVTLTQSLNYKLYMRLSRDQNTPDHMYWFSATYSTTSYTASIAYTSDFFFSKAILALRDSPTFTGTPTAPTAASGTNTTQIATTAFVQNALSNMGAGGSEMVDVTITGSTSSASFSTNPYNAIKAVVDDGKIAVLNANVDPLSATGVLIPVYEYTYSQSGSDFTGYKGKIQNGNYEISVDVQSTSSATVTITSVGSSITVDTALSESSTNPVQNRVITAQILENEEIVATALNNLNDRVELKQDQLVSGTTIKTINNQSILGSGNINISGGGGGGGGEENVIEIVKVNGTALTPDANKAVNIPLDSTPTANSGNAVTSGGIKSYVDGRRVVYNISFGGEEVVIDNVTYYGIVNQALADAIIADVTAGKEVILADGDGGYNRLDSVLWGMYLFNTGGVKGYDFIVVSDTSSFQGYNILYRYATSYQERLVSGTNIKTVNNNSLLGSGNLSVGTYSKPSGGIPKTDLASAVQTSLGKADTALQPDVDNDLAQGTISSSNSQGFNYIIADKDTSSEQTLQDALDAKASTSAVNAKYTKPSGGIPANDLATAVTQRLLPEGSGSTDDGKIVQYSYLGGGWQLVKPITIYTGSSAPSSSTGSNGDIYIQTS